MRPVTAETDLLLCAARTKLAECDAERIVRLAEGELNWTLLLQLAYRHKVLPLLCRSLDRSCRRAVPEAVMHQLRRSHLANISLNLALAAALPKLLDLFSARSIKAIPFKGLEVAMTAYEGLSWRHIGDLDIMTDEKDFPAASELLLSRGYRAVSDWGWERGFADPSGRIRVDLHRAIAAPSLAIRIDFEYWEARQHDLNIPGGSIPSVPPEDLMLLLCVQIAKDGYVGRCELKKICDVAELIRSQPQFEWQLAVRNAERLGCRRILFLGLLAASDLLEATLPEFVVDRIGAEPGMGLLTRHLYEGLFVGMQESPSAEAEERFRLAVRERWRDRMRPRFDRFRKMFMPSERDRSVLRLPAHLEFLYYLIRPVRLLGSALVRLRNRQS